MEGVGGKLNTGETVKQAAIREAKEEINVDIKALKRVATLDFYFQPNSDFDQQVIVYLVRQWGGDPQETEEMRPKWFKMDDLPFKKMWEDDIYWLPKVLSGQKVKAGFTFGENDKLLKQNVKLVP